MKGWRTPLLQFTRTSPISACHLFCLVAFLFLALRCANSYVELQGSTSTNTVEDQRDFTNKSHRHIPFQFKFGSCNGLTNQKLQIYDGVLVALFLGAQIVLPEKIVLNGAQFVSVTDLNMQRTDYMFNISRFQDRVQRQYADFWCRRPKFLAFKIWCKEMPPPVLVYDTDVDSKIHEIQLAPHEWGADALSHLGNNVLKDISGHHRFVLNPAIQRISATCEFWLQVKIVEGTEFWDNFWKIHNSLELNDDIVERGETVKLNLLNRFGSVARRKAMKLGYTNYEHSAQYGGYHVVHFRAEKDWQRHCDLWFSWIDRRDNCINNTWQIGNVLLSEGISPALPVYLATGLSENDIEQLHNMASMHSFFEIFTVVTKGMLGLVSDVGSDREYWAAVDFILGEEADWFVGNSISTFSALMMEIRARRKMPILPYNGGKMALEEINCIRPHDLTLIPPVRDSVKWVFTFPHDVVLHDEVYNTTVAAVKSALANSHVVPVCVTTADPYSETIVNLVSMGVRLLYHKPSWMEAAANLAEWWNDIASRSNFQFLRPLSAEYLTAEWLRIDLPILGMLDDFILYTDSAILFTKDVNWVDLFGENHASLARSMQMKMFSGPFFDSYASPGSVGVPMFFATPLGDNRPQSNVMLMNLKNMRQSYTDFRSYVMRKQQLLKIDGFDPCSYFDFYKGTLLPSLGLMDQSEMR